MVLIVMVVSHLENEVNSFSLKIGIARIASFDMSRRRNTFWVISANSESVLENKIGIFLRALLTITQNDSIPITFQKLYSKSSYFSHIVRHNIP